MLTIFSYYEHGEGFGEKEPTEKVKAGRKGSKGAVYWLAIFALQ